MVRNWLNRLIAGTNKESSVAALLLVVFGVYWYPLLTIGVILGFSLPLFSLYFWLKVKDEEKFRPSSWSGAEAQKENQQGEIPAFLAKNRQSPDLILSKKPKFTFEKIEEGKSEISFGENGQMKKKDSNEKNEKETRAGNELPGLSYLRPRQKEENGPRKIKTFDLIEKSLVKSKHKRASMESYLMKVLNESNKKEIEKIKRTQEIRKEAEEAKRKQLEMENAKIIQQNSIPASHFANPALSNGASGGGLGSLGFMGIKNETGLRGESLKMIGELLGESSPVSKRIQQLVPTEQDLAHAHLVLNDKKYGQADTNPMGVILSILLNTSKYFKKKEEMLELVQRELSNEKYTGCIEHFLALLSAKIPKEEKEWESIAKENLEMKTLKQWSVLLIAASLILSEKKPHLRNAFTKTVHGVVESQIIHPLMAFLLLVSVENCGTISQALFEGVKRKCSALESAIQSNSRLESMAKDVKELRTILSTKTFKFAPEPEIQEPSSQEYTGPSLGSFQGVPVPMGLGSFSPIGTKNHGGFGQVSLNQNDQKVQTIGQGMVSGFGIDLSQKDPTKGRLQSPLGMGLNNTGLSLPNPQMSGLGGLSTNQQASSLFSSPLNPQTSPSPFPTFSQLPSSTSNAPLPSSTPLSQASGTTTKPVSKVNPIETIKQRIASDYFIDKIYNEIWNFQDVEELSAHIPEDSRYFKSINETVTRINGINFRKWKINYDGRNCSEEEKLQNLPPNILILRTFKNFLHNLHSRKPDYRYVQWMNDSRRVDTFCFNTFLLTPVIVAYPQYVEVLILVFFKRFKGVLIDKKNIGQDAEALEEFRGKNGLLDSDDDFGYLFLYLLTMILYVLQWNVRHLEYCFPNEFELPDYFKERYPNSLPMIPCFFDSYLWLISHLKTLPPSPVSFLVTRAVISTGEVLFFGRIPFDLSQPDNVPELPVIIQESKNFRDLVNGFGKKHMKPGTQEWENLVEKSILRPGEKKCLAEAFNTLKVDVSLRQLEKLETTQGTFLYEDWRHRDMFINIDLKENKNRDFAP